MARLVGVLTSVLAGLAFAVAGAVGLSAVGNPDANVNFTNAPPPNNVYGSTSYGSR